MKKNKIISLENGLKIVIYQDNTKHSMFAELIVNYGAIDKDFILGNTEFHICDGVAHFLEHLLLEHSIYGNAMKHFQNNYIKSNGLTSSEFTKFYIHTVKDFKENLKKLIKIVNVPNFNEEDIETTKGAIFEEIKKYKDNKFADFNTLINSCLFKNIGFKTVLGSEKELSSIDYNIAKLCYDVFYRPSNQILAIAGNIDIDEIVELVKSIYSDIEKNEVDYKKIDFNEPNEVSKHSACIYKDVTKEYMSLNYKINISHLSSFEKVKLTFYLTDFLSYSFGQTSDAYKKLIEDNISVNKINYGYHFIDSFVIVEIGTYTSKFDKFSNMIVDIMKNKKVDEDDFEIRKKRSIISLITREDDFINMIMPFVDNVAIFNYYHIDEIKDIEASNFNDYKNMIFSLDFSNYCITKMLKKD